MTSGCAIRVWFRKIVNVDYVSSRLYTVHARSLSWGPLEIILLIDILAQLHVAHFLSFAKRLCVWFVFRLEKEYTRVKHKEAEDNEELRRLKTENRLLLQRIDELEKVNVDFVWLFSFLFWLSWSITSPITCTLHYFLSTPLDYEREISIAWWLTRAQRKLTITHRNRERII